MRLFSPLVLALLCVLPTVHADSTGAASPREVLELVRRSAPPARDLERLRASVREPVSPRQPETRPSGAVWVNDVVQRNYRAVPVELRMSSEHVDWYVEVGRVLTLERVVEEFERGIFPEVTRLTGVRWPGDALGARRLAVIHSVTPGVAGYVSALDLLPARAFRYSNERPTIYLNPDSFHHGSPGHLATMAHELEHLAHAVTNPVQEGWLDEGIAEVVASLVTSAPQGSVALFRSQPDVQLNAWSEKPWEARAHYEASALWIRYLLHRAGGPDALTDLVTAGGRGFETTDRFIRARGLGSGTEALFGDWLVATAIGDPYIDPALVRFRSGNGRASLAGTLRRGGEPVEDSVHQFAADYYGLPAGPGVVRVQIAPEVSLVETVDSVGGMFWSQRSDNMDSRMTRAFNLTGLSSASLRYRVWHETELDYDLCYVFGSIDGSTWTALRSARMSDEDRIGLGLGAGYTGRNSEWPAWGEDEVDLSPIAGQVAFVRYSCITDQSYSASGMALDDLRVPELGFHDSGDQDLGWVLEGFLRAPNAMAQPAIVRIVSEVGQEVRIIEVPLDALGSGTAVLDGTVDRATLIIAGAAPRTLGRMRYRLWME